MPGLAKLIPKLVTALFRRTADFSSSEKALTAALPNWTTAAVPKAMPKLPARFLTLLLSFWLALSTCLKPLRSALEFNFIFTLAFSAIRQPYLRCQNWL